MKNVLLTTSVSPLIVVAAWVGGSPAQIPMCPPEVASAKAMLNAKGSDLQASRSQDVQAPRDQQDVQAPRSSNASASSTQTARALVREAEAACKAGDTAQASEKALAALAMMKR